MTDQRSHAGNLGDVVKHCVVADLAAWLGRVEPGGDWAETHAGFHHYDAVALGGTGGDARRRPTYGRLRQSLAEGQDLGVYGQVIAPWLREGKYPGSLVIAATAGPTLRLRGHDIGEEQVASFRGDDRIRVALADGFTGVRGADLVVCDPFWDDGATWNQVAQLVAAASQVVVWFPLRDDLRPDRFAALGLDGVLGQDRAGKGAGMAWRLPDAAASSACDSLDLVARVLDLRVTRWASEGVGV